MRLKHNDVIIQVIGFGILDTFTHLKKSLIKTKKRNGPKTDPCSTPVKIGLLDELGSLSVIY